MVRYGGGEALHGVVDAALVDDCPQFRPDAQQGLTVRLPTLELALFDFEFSPEFFGGVLRSGSGEAGLVEF
jgi:hypothetical protein